MEKLEISKTGSRTGKNSAFTLGQMVLVRGILNGATTRIGITQSEKNKMLKMEELSRQVCASVAKRIGW